MSVGSTVVNWQLDIITLPIPTQGIGADVPVSNAAGPT